MENKLTAEQMEQLKACKTAEEVKAFAEKENIEMTDEQLEAIAGGAVTVPLRLVCPYCHKPNPVRCHDFNHKCSFCGKSL